MQQMPVAQPMPQQGYTLPATAAAVPMQVTVPARRPEGVHYTSSVSQSR